MTTTTAQSTTSKEAIILFSFIFLAGVLVQPALVQAQTPSTAIADQISVLNDALVKTSGGGPATAGLVRRRAVLFSELIASDPAAALRAALPESAAGRLRTSAQAADIESRGEWEGQIEAVVGDDFAGQRSETRRYLQTPGGRFELFFSNRPASAGQRLAVRGLRLQTRVAVETVAPSEPNQQASNGNAQNSAMQSACSTTGAQKIAVLMLTMPSNQAFPAGYTQASLQQAFFGTSDTKASASLNGFWKEVSYGQTSATGQVFGPFALTRDYDYSTQSDLASEALSVADASVDFTQFSRISFVFPQTGWGGFTANGSVGCNAVTSLSKGSLRLSEAWFPAFPNSQPSVGIIAHEMGHALGLGHSSTEDFGTQPLGPLGTDGASVELGDRFDTMGNNAGHYAAQQKSALRWLNSGAGYQEVTTPGTFSVQPLEAQAGGDSRALHILRDAGTSSWLWLEYRQPVGDVDQSLGAGGSNVFSGALLRYQDQVDNIHLLNFNAAAAPNDFSKAALTPGQSWSDPFSPLTVTANRATSNGLDVSVSYDAPCAALQYSATSFPAAGGSGSIAITAPENCSWTAQSTAGWITFTGQTSGSGNGTVSFDVAGNGGRYQKDAYVYLQRQSTRILVRGNAVSALGVSPVMGSGSSGRFTFQYEDPNGFQDLSTANISFGSSNDCQIQVNLATQDLWLNGDSGSMTGPINLLNPGASLANSNCSVASTGSSITNSATQSQLQLQMTFYANFSGGHRVTSGIATAGGASNAMAAGTWMVPSAKKAFAAVQQTGVTIQASVAGAPFSVDGATTFQAPATFNWAAGQQHTITWLASGPQAGTHYGFLSWTDGGTNPRTITVSDPSATYTANIKVQYLLSLGAAPANGGGVTASPVSKDGYYDAGTTVALSPSAAPGFSFGSFSGALSGGTQPQSVTMTGPLSVTGNFNCKISYPAAIFGPMGPGAAHGLFQFQAGPGCGWTVVSDSAWLTLNGPSSGSGLSSQTFSVDANSGANRTARVTVTFSDGGLPNVVLVRQDASSSLRPSITLMTPQIASGLSQTFSLQLNDPGDVQFITDLFLNIDPYPSANPCDISFSRSSGQWFAAVNGGNNVLMGGTDNATDPVCQINGSQFSFSGSGTTATLTFGITFQPAYAGPRTLAGGFHNSQTNLSTAYQVLGQFTVVPTAQTITFPAIANMASSAGSFALSATASSGLAVSYVSNSPAVCTVSGSTLTILIAGGCSITATQTGDATYSAAPPVTRTFTVLFSDISGGEYYANAVNSFAQDRITAGCGSNNYCPGASVTRDQMAIFLVRAVYGSDNFTSSSTPYFNDVPANNFAFKWIQKLYELGITGGCGVNIYCPTAIITREQLAIFLIRVRYGLGLAGSPPAFTYSTTPYFTDVPPTDFGFAWVQRLKKDAITAGCTATTYCPGAPVIRGDMAILILRAAMNQLLPPGTPVIGAISPSTLALGTSETFTVTGTNTNFVQGVTTISPIPGMTIGNVTVNSPTSLTVQLTAAVGATAQPYSIVAITNSEEAVLPNGLLLQ